MGTYVRRWRRMDIDEASKKAISFLLHKQDKKGWWNDFYTLAGYSDEWVTGYIGSVLAEIPVKRAQNAVSTAWRLLKWRGFFSKGWSYSRYVPTDADSTAWVLKLAESLNKNSLKVKRAQRYLDSSVTADGGIPTYANLNPIRKFIQFKDGESLDGWCSKHCCVTAAVACLGSLKNKTKLLNYLRNQQHGDGSWPAYWWCDREYSTALAVIALKADTNQKDKAQIHQAVKWVLGRLDSKKYIRNKDYPTGSPFASSWAIHILIEASNSGYKKARKDPHNLIEWLIEKQLTDGSWQSSSRLRIPHPYDKNPDKFNNWDKESLGSGSIRTDVNRLFTTATVLSALWKYKKWLEN